MLNLVQVYLWNHLHILASPVEAQALLFAFK
jgi:hypothetical protein